MANRKFRKGQKVARIVGWDGKGTFAVQLLTVGSAGAKQIHLLKDDGTLAVRFPADGVNRSGVDFIVDATEAYMDLALATARVYLARERATYADLIARNGSDPRYVRAITRELEALHEPRVGMYAALAAAL